MRPPDRTGTLFQTAGELTPERLKQQVEARLAEFSDRMATLLADFEAHIAAAALT